MMRGMEGIEGKRCVVTGAGGFIGRALCERLARAGGELIGLDANPTTRERVEATGAQFAQCDVTDGSAVAAALAGAQLIVHTAAIVTDYGEMDDFVAVNVRGTRNVLDAALETSADRVVHLSSVVRFGYEHASELDDEAFARAAGIPYLDTKAASDALALERGKRGDKVTVVRPGDVYGPGSIPWAVRPLEAIRKRQFVLIDGGTGLMLPVYVDDLVESIVLALTVPDARGEALTVWDGSAVTCAEFFNNYALMLGRRKIPSLPRPIAHAAAGAQELIARLTGRPPQISRNAITFVSRKAPLSNRRARELLGWEPQVTLDEGMRRTEEWFRAEGLL